MQSNQNKSKEGNVSLQSLHSAKMKDRTWLIVTIVMGLALIISVGYSLNLRKKINKKTDVIVSRSIVQITASNVSIKNVVTAKGKIEGDIVQDSKDNEENIQNESNQENNAQETDENIKQEVKKYHIKINLSDEVVNKIKPGQKVDISIKNEDKKNKYEGKISKIEQDETNKKKAIVEFNFDENVKENQEAECTIIIEEAKDVIALPIAAVKTRKLDDNIENNTSNKNQLNTTNDTNSVNTANNNSKEEKYAIVVNDDGTTSEIVVKTGISDEYYVEIISGLSEGQKVQIEEE